MTAPRICKKIAVAATPKAVNATSQKLTKIATAVPKLGAGMMNYPVRLVLATTTTTIKQAKMKNL